MQRPDIDRAPDTGTFPPVAELVPQAPPMVLLDRVVSFEGGRIVCELTLTEASPYVESGRAPALVTLEYMAQAIATAAGLEKRASGLAPRIGFLLGSRELHLATDFVYAGDVLTVEAVHLWGKDRIGQYDCVVSRDGARIARGPLTVYEPSDEELLQVGMHGGSP